MNSIIYNLMILFLVGCLIKSYGQAVYSEDGYRYGNREEIVKNYVNN